MQHVELMRLPEKNSRVMLLLAFWCEYSPDGIERSQPQRFGVVSLIVHPAIDVIRKTALRERLQRKSFQLRRNPETIDHRSLFRRLPRQRFLENEFALHRI